MAPRAKAEWALVVRVVSLTLTLSSLILCTPRSSFSAKTISLGDSKETSTIRSTPSDGLFGTSGNEMTEFLQKQQGSPVRQDAQKIKHRQEGRNAVPLSASTCARSGEEDVDDDPGEEEDEEEDDEKTVSSRYPPHA